MDAPTAGDLVDEAERRRLAGDPPIAMLTNGIWARCGNCNAAENMPVMGDPETARPLAPTAFKCEACGLWNTLPVYMNASAGGRVDPIPLSRWPEFPSLTALDGRLTSR